MILSPYLRVSKTGLVGSYRALSVEEVQAVVKGTPLSHHDSMTLEQQRLTYSYDGFQCLLTAPSHPQHQSAPCFMSVGVEYLPEGFPAGAEARDA